MKQREARFLGAGLTKRYAFSHNHTAQSPGMEMDADLHRSIAETTRMLMETSRMDAERELRAAQRRAKLGQWAGLVEIGLPMLAGASAIGFGIVIASLATRLVR